MAIIAIIGAGPAGLMAAERLSGDGHTVHVFDHKPSAARKFLMAGRGGLNITHSEDMADFVRRYGDAQEFMRPFLSAFSPTDLRAWCHAHGEDTFIGSSGRVFPKSFKATPLLRHWLNNLDRKGVIFHFHHFWSGWRDNSLCFTTPDGAKAFAPDATLLALGGASWPRLGSDAAWVPLLREKGVVIHNFRPSNCGFMTDWSPYFVEHYAGTPLKNMALTFGAITLRGEVMITAKGVEGGGIYALSAPLRDAIAAHGCAVLTCDLKPDTPSDKLLAQLAKPRGRDSFGNTLRKQAGLPPVAIALLQEDRHVSALPPPQLVKRIKEFDITLTAPFDIDRAISSAGGIDRAMVTPDLMLKNIPGVFVAGEMIDWEAPTGGYLLQACCSMGVWAAKGINEYLARDQRI